MLLWFHPMIGDYEGLRDVTTRFQVVHVGMVLALPLLAIAIYGLLDGLRGRAAAVGRFALIPFVVFYVPYVAFEGIALGVLGEQLNGLPADQRDAIAPGMVQDFASNPIFGEPGLFWALGSTALIVVMVSTVLAFRRAGAPPALQVLLGASVLIGAHAPPLASIGWACFAAAGWMVLRARHSRGREAGRAGRRGQEPVVTTTTAARFASPRLADLVRAIGRESGLFVLGVAMIALHVLDDSFLQPSPGTSAGDHLVSGLVPLAVLALAAWIYPRVRGGRRGAMALVFGAFGIVAGVEAVHYATKVGRVR